MYLQCCLSSANGKHIQLNTINELIKETNNQNHVYSEAYSMQDEKRSVPMIQQWATLLWLLVIYLFMLLMPGWIVYL